MGRLTVITGEFEEVQCFILSSGSHFIATQTIIFNDCRSHIIIIIGKMAEEEKAPLLQSHNDEEISGTRHRRRPQLFPTEPVRSNAVCADDRIFINANATTPTETEADTIVCIFVVAFDTRSGRINISIWILILLQTNCPTENFNMLVIRDYH